MITQSPVHSVRVAYTRGPMLLARNGTGFDVSLPIIDVQGDYLRFQHDGQRTVVDRDQSRLIVRGRSWIAIQTSDGRPTHIPADYERRWCTIPALEVATMLDIADRDGTINDIRMLSLTAGPAIRFTGETRHFNHRFAGSEPALLLQLDSSPEALSLATTYSFAYQTQRTFNRPDGTPEEVTYTNAIIISKSAADAARGVNTYPTLNYVDAPTPHNADTPNWFDAIDMARTLGRLPDGRS